MVAAGAALFADGAVRTHPPSSDAPEAVGGPHPEALRVAYANVFDGRWFDVTLPSDGAIGCTCLQTQPAEPCAHLWAAALAVDAETWRDRPPAALRSIDRPSLWIRRHSGLVPPGPVLDLACGGGRHGRWFLDRWHPVTLVDRDLQGVEDLAGRPDAERVTADLEAGPWPLPGRTFSAVVVTNYLWRPLFPALIDAVAPGGALLIETFAEGHPGRPSNPAFHLRPGELLEAVRGPLEVRAYHHGLSTSSGGGSVTQAICAVRTR
ncbi:MAG: class I SAM-dependent methyltransferase [Myxococcota bacterium]